MQITTESSVASMNKPKISIIVPVYNTELYLRECIESILRQSFMNFEVLLVDDGSTDASGSICEDYAAKDTRIRVFHQTNQGVTAARKLGLEYARGEFICFVDSDDKITSNALEILFSNMRDGVDIVICDSERSGYATGNEFLNQLLKNEILISLWGKLYRKELLISSGALDIRREINIGEDYLANIKMALLVSRIVYVPTVTYLYQYNPDSAVQTRKWSLAYEEMFRIEVEKVLGNRLSEFEESWYKFQLRTLENLIIHRIKFSYKRAWIQELLRTKQNYALTNREKIICKIRNAALCRYILALESRINYKK